MDVGRVVKEEIGNNLVASRFRGYMPVVVDVETAGFNARTDALLEIAAVTLRINEKNMWVIDSSMVKYVEPFEGANLDQAALDFTGIDPDHPFRKQIAVPEKEALQEIFKHVRKSMKLHACKRAIMVGHNPSFDLGFLIATAERAGIKRNPFHPFSTFDTATLGGLAFGQTVLSHAVIASGLKWDNDQAHSAKYDAEQTAALFCEVVNRWTAMTSRQ